MYIVNNIELYNGSLPTSIALGTFDGVHLAHRRVIDAAINTEYLPAVFTFNQSPAGVINGEPVATLTTKRTKQKIMESLGIELYISPDFLDIKDLCPTEFVNMLHERFCAKHLVCGFNFRFGKDTAGNASVLKQLCREKDISVDIVPPFLYGDEPVSSTRIRTLIENGEIEKANELLGDNFTIDFKVSEGNQIGRSIDIPTINQEFSLNFIVPRRGVYASKCLVDGIWHKSISNIGKKPTVGSDFDSCETFIFDYNGNLYGKEVTVMLYAFLRDERKFEDINELQTAIKRDIDCVSSLEY